MEKLPARSWPNRKLAPTHTSDACSHSASTVRTNVSGSHRESSGREADDGDAVEAGALDPLEPLGFRHQQRRRLVGTNYAWRMRIERHHQRRGGALGRHAAHALDDLDVTAMQAVEVAQRQDGMLPARRTTIVGKVDDVHGPRGRAAARVHSVSRVAGLNAHRQRR
jgi:hypothetical protein